MMNIIRICEWIEEAVKQFLGAYKTQALIPLLLFMLTSFGFSKEIGQMSTADNLFEKKTYQEALKEYEAIYKNATGDEQLKALYRIAESKALLFRYSEALQTIVDAKLPEDRLWKARFLILKAELYREYLKQYGYAARTDVVEGEKDVTRKTPQQMHSEINAAYDELWNLKEKLFEAPLDNENYFVDIKDIQEGFYPTVWDFVVLRWSEYLLNEATEDTVQEKPKAMVFLGEAYPLPQSISKLSTLNPLVHRAAVLMEDASRSHRSGRQEAAELWKVMRLMIPFNHSYKVMWSKDWKAERAAAITTLQSWIETFTESESKAEAGYQAAMIFNQEQKYESAVNQCDEVTKNWRTTYGAQKCTRLVAEIKQPSLSLQALLSPSAGYTPEVTTRNLKEIHFRVYATTPEELVKIQPSYYQRQWSQIMNNPGQDILKYFLLSKSPLHRWQSAVNLPQPASIYEYRTTKAEIPKTDFGIYMLLASNDAGFAPGESLISGVVLNNTDIILIGTSGFNTKESNMIFDPDGQNEKTIDGFNFYVLNGISGKSLNKAKLDIFYYSYREQVQKIFLESGLDGRAQLPVKVDLHPYTYNNYTADALALYNKSYAYWQNATYLYFSAPPPVELYIDTDRPIYRPGQKVHLKISTILKTPQGIKIYQGKSKITVTALDANSQQFFTEEKTANEMGSAAAEFVIPTGRLLGYYRINATITEWGYTFSGYGSFAVEEYKRPEFEVKLLEAKGPWRFGKEAKIEGDVRYYFGGAVPDAPVVIKVSREPYIPWFCWWWSWRYASYGRTEILRHETKTDANGHFIFPFTPQAQDPNEADPLPSRIVVEIEARDSGGRTITGEKSYVAGKNAYLFSIEFPSGFFMSQKPYSIPTKMMNLNEQPVSGKASYEIFHISKDPEIPANPSFWQGYFGQNISLDQIYKDIPNGEKVAQGNLDYDGKASTPVSVKNLGAGAYRLTLKTNDPWGGEITQSVILVVADAEKNMLPLKLSSLTIPEHTEFEVGQTARFLIGSYDINEAIHIEVWSGQNLLSHKLLPGSGIRVFELPITTDLKGGFALRWFGIRNFNVGQGQALIKVPWKEKNLIAHLNYDKKLAPGQKVNWSINAKDINGVLINGEALVTIYDRSLEYYAQFNASWITNLFAQKQSSNYGASSTFQPYAGYIPIEKGWIKQILEQFQRAMKEPELPMLRLQRSRVRYQRYPAAPAQAGQELDLASVQRAEKPREESEMMDKKKSVSSNEPVGSVHAKGGALGMAAPAPPPPPPPTRTQFAETALFEPQLAIKNGKAQFSFSMPEQLTGWRIRAQILTADLKNGLLSEETVTQKDLMVRVEIPRFFREGDLGTIKAVVHNETDKEMTGNLELSVTEEGKPSADLLALKDLVKNFSVKPHSLQAFSWSIAVPKRITSYKVKAIARSNALADAEEREFPVLPSRQRLIETTVVALNGDVTKTLAIKAFDKEDPTRQNESMIVQIDPQLALTILNSIPFLVKYPFECVEQLTNRFVPLSVVNEVYKKYPNIARATAKIPKRNTITPEWDRTDPRRMMTLMETPWEEISKGIKTIWPIIDMLNPDTVKREKEDALAKIKSAQLSNGAFPWFPGGPEDLYMTLYVLAGFAEAKRYGVEIPEDVVRKALNYVNNEIPKRLKPKEEYVSIILYAAYVVTSYPKEYPESVLGWKFAQAWIDFADKHSDAMTQYGKALAAYVYWRLGDKVKGNAYLDRAMDGAREDEITGVYWTPEKNSWLWYNDTVETHAFMLRTLQTIRPKDRHISGMVQWLLFNRKGTEWKSTKASSAAVYALLDFMEKSGALEHGDQYSLTWGEVKDSVAVAPDDWLSKPLRWTRTGADITAAYGKPKIDKKGPGFAFASMTWMYSTDQIPEASEGGLMTIQRTFYRRVKEKDAYHLQPLKSGDTVNVGDQIEVQIKITTRSQFEYVHLKDLKGAGFEAEELRSGWKWDQIGRYEEPRDSLTNFFFSWLPHGEYIMRYRIRPTMPGKYRIGAAILQSMYAPEFSAHSAGIELGVTSRP